uniref:Uncharacterized protein n=1 Tax=Cucumis melo TaxID=3656 RepID=A0A9I9EGL6_CUCME
MLEVEEILNSPELHVHKIRVGFSFSFGFLLAIGIDTTTSSSTKQLSSPCKRFLEKDHILHSSHQHIEKN